MRTSGRYAAIQHKVKLSNVRPSSAFGSGTRVSDVPTVLKVQADVILLCGLPEGPLVRPLPAFTARRDFDDGRAPVLHPGPNTRRLVTSASGFVLEPRYLALIQRGGPRRLQSASEREEDAMADPIGNMCTEDASKYTHAIIREVMFALRSAYRLNDPKPLFKEYIACVPSPHGAPSDIERSD